MNDELSRKSVKGIRWEIVKPSEEILTQREALKFLKVSSTKIVSLRKKNEIPFQIHKGCYFYQKADCVDWIRKNQPGRLTEIKK